MTPAEFRTTREALGFTGDALAAYLKTTSRTVRNWEAGNFAIPDGVADQLRALELLTSSYVDDLVRQATDEGAPAVITYRDDETFHAAHPNRAHFPAAWHRTVTKRAASRLRGVRIDYPEEQEGP
ncbi:helix-turn-helix domain-containing protein [Streptomyces uncialis]|uniref:helix-turn-helix domain-containing protein n=1 Tax=Streptomyces uncialis TaxID=1048205 RepID=UPI003825E62C